MRKTFLAALLALLLPAALPGALSPASSSAAAPETRDFNQPKLRWWQEARFGMFIHWNPSSLIGKEISWSRSSYGAQRYDSLYLRFNPAEFSPEHWVETAKKAGIHDRVTRIQQTLHSIKFSGAVPLRWDGSTG